MSLRELELVLEQERLAIARLNSALLVELAQQKEMLFAQLDPTTESKEDIQRLRQTAQINLLLLNDAIDLVAERLGRAPTHQTYNERGQPNQLEQAPSAMRV